MSRHSDEDEEMSTQVAGPNAPAPDDQDDVARFLLELRALGEVDPPTPSRELAALLGGATPLFSQRRAMRRIVLRSGIVAAAIVAALIVAAAHQGLPQPAQRVVSNVVDVLTPFDLPRGDVGVPLTPTTPTPSPSDDRPAGGPGSGESSEPGDDGPSDEPSRGAGPDDGPSAGEPSEGSSGSWGGPDNNGGPGGGWGDDGGSGSGEPSGDGYSGAPTGGSNESGGDW